MNEADLASLFEVFERTERQGPGSEATTSRALSALPTDLRVERILDLGCGTGGSTIVLARETHAHVTAVDLHAPFLERLRQRAAQMGLGERVTTVVMDMANAGRLGADFDLIWAEGSAYSIGFRNALDLWRPLLRPSGCMVVTELVWFTDLPSAGASQFFSKEYPDMRTEAECITVAAAVGLDLVDAFRLPAGDWHAFYAGVDRALRIAIEARGDSPVYAALRDERDVHAEFGHEYGYLCLLLQRTDSVPASARS